MGRNGVFSCNNPETTSMSSFTQAAGFLSQRWNATTPKNIKEIARRLVPSIKTGSHPKQHVIYSFSYRTYFGQISSFLIF